MREESIKDTNYLQGELNDCEEKNDADLENCWDTNINLLSENNQISSELNRYKNRMPEFLDIAGRVAFHREYNFPEWGCHNMSVMLVEELENIGYEAKLQRGYLQDMRHDWVIVKIPIEATSGKIIEPAEYKENYEEDY